MVRMLKHILLVLLSEWVWIKPQGERQHYYLLDVLTSCLVMSFENSVIKVSMKRNAYSFSRRRL
jgi:hypothetical protein